MNSLLVLAALGAQMLIWDPVTVDANGGPEVVTKSEVEITDQGLAAKAIGGPSDCSIGVLVYGRGPGVYSLRVRVADAAGNWGAWSPPLAYVIEPPPPPKPTKIVISYSHNGKDINGNSLLLTASQCRCVARGSGATGAALGTFNAGPIGQGGQGAFEVNALGGSIVDCDAFIRVRSASGWSGYYGPIPFRWPPTEPQPPQKAQPLTVPGRPENGKAEAKP